MSDDCTDKYEAWKELNDKLDELREKADGMDGWEDAWKQYARDMGNGNFADAAEHVWEANEEQWEQAQVNWEADRLENGPWSDAVNDLWDCIHKSS
ncbi:hypothetical protein GCM10010169_63850 [Micromonospora fulviviridis]|uniref:hypothetical protein n=1 Tax=Micromonospora fulviviridis TaxID=47860 RepID=UPI001666F546|nr:hypothetical protein [Micromonospora fulviviridis]GGS10297.1 hypothetical protein GCM10010169_63850 [Micromonospora fulviviridis]